MLVHKCSRSKVLQFFDHTRSPMLHVIHELRVLITIAYGWVVAGALSYTVCIILDSISGGGF